MHPVYKKGKLSKLKHFVSALLICTLIGCKGYSYVSLNLSQPGEFSTKIGSISDKVTDLSIKGSFNNTDTQQLIDIATSSDLLTSIDLRNCDVELPHHAFAGCINLKRISLPTSMKGIPHHLLSGCTSLKEVKIPSNYKVIGDDAFSNCTSLEKIEIPATLESIENYAFRGCNNLKEIRCSATVPPTCTNYCFNDIAKECKLVVPKGCGNIYHNAIGWEKINNIEEAKNVIIEPTSWDKY